MGTIVCRTLHPSDGQRVLVTQALPGERWLQLLAEAGFRVDACVSERMPDEAQIRAALGENCAAVIGQLTESWNAGLLAHLKAVGGRVYANYAVGYDNVDVRSATELGLPVGNTPGVLTETTAELAVALTFAAARRVVEGDAFMRAGGYQGWLPSLFLGERLWRGRLGVIGAGRIGAAYARMMVEGHKMDLVYHDPAPQPALEEYVAAYGRFLTERGEEAASCRRAASVEDVLREADVVSIHTVLDPTTRHLIDARRLALMRDTAILVNTSRGPIVDEAALVEHCRSHLRFRAGLDVFEHEPAMAPGLAKLPNVVVLPHLGSATSWTREGMAVLAARNVVGILNGWPAWVGFDPLPFLDDDAPRAAPSIVNATDLGLPLYDGRS